jgi:hypothetical protein
MPVPLSPITPAACALAPDASGLPAEPVPVVTGRARDRHPGIGA